jgi:4-hydroxybenzoate polyprenyltransferase
MTYSKLFGHRKITIFIILVMAIDMVTSSILMYELVPIAVLSVVLSYVWFVFQGRKFIRDPNRFKLVDKVVIYEYVTETTMVLVELFYIWNRWMR